MTKPQQTCYPTAIAAACFIFGLLGSAQAQTTDFGTTTKTITLPKGSKIDPRYLLRRKKSDTEPAKELTAEEKQAEADKQLADALDAKLLGAWTRVASVTESLTADATKAAAKRCFQQLKLKPLAFEKTAARQLPDIDALFGDTVYYRTEKGLQRLDINSGGIRLISGIAAKQLNNSQLVWTLTGESLRLRLRFSKPLANAPKARFMIEESGFFLRCPSNKDDLFNVDQ